MSDRKAHELDEKYDRERSQRERREECRQDAELDTCVSKKEAERGKMRDLLREKGLTVIGTDRTTENELLDASDSQLFSWMQQFYGYNHHKLWRKK